MENRRDPIRLGFAFLGPIILMIVFGYGITFDVEHLSYAVLDHDRTPESRQYLETTQAPATFSNRLPLRDYAQLETRMRSGELKFSVEIPGIRRNLTRGRRPEVGLWLDGAMPFGPKPAVGMCRGCIRPTSRT